MKLWLNCHIILTWVHFDCVHCFKSSRLDTANVDKKIQLDMVLTKQVKKRDCANTSLLSMKYCNKLGSHAYVTTVNKNSCQDLEKETQM